MFCSFTDVKLWHQLVSFFALLMNKISSGGSVNLFSFAINLSSQKVSFILVEFVFRLEHWKLNSLSHCEIGHLIIHEIWAFWNLHFASTWILWPLVCIKKESQHVEEIMWNLNKVLFLDTLTWTNSCQWQGYQRSMASIWANSPGETPNWMNFRKVSGSQGN